MQKLGYCVGHNTFFFKKKKINNNKRMFEWCSEMNVWLPNNSKLVVRPLRRVIGGGPNHLQVLESGSIISKIC
jgi:hypothetical protein